MIIDFELYFLLLSIIILFITKSNGMVKIIENYTLHEQIGEG